MAVFSATSDWLQAWPGPVLDRGALVLKADPCRKRAGSGAVSPPDGAESDLKRGARRQPLADPGTLRGNDRVAAAALRPGD